MSRFSDMLIFLRKRSGLTQKDLADKVGMSRSSIAMYETGEREPSLELAETFADIFNVNMDTLMGKNNASNKAPTPVSENGRLQEFLELFSQLTAEEQALIIVQIKGILSSR